MIPRLSDTRRETLTGWLNAVLALCGLTSLTMLVLVVGWPLSDPVRMVVRYATSAVLGLFVLQEIVRLALQRKALAFVRDHRIEMLLAATVVLEFLFGRHIASWLGQYVPDVSASTLTLVFLGLNQVVLVSVITLRLLRHMPLLHSRALSPGLVFILSFAFLIVAGTLLLKTPHATPEGIGWVDALFLSTSAVCVTGLSPLDISVSLTSHGHWILLGLIQVGGLGVMTITYFFAYFMTGEVTLRSRIALQDLLSEDNLGQIGTVLALIIGFTAALELAGTLAIHASLSGTTLPEGERVFFALFHSISAFCNAGFSTLGPGLADPRVGTSMPLQGAVMALIVIGGLGFPVVKGFWVYVAGRIRYRLRLTERLPARLSVNARLVLLTTACLVAGGTVTIWLTEFAWGDGPSTGNTWWTALFHSVTARTAGFNVTPVTELLPASAALMMALMFIGGSPSSTAGGIKTSTLAVAVLSLRRVILGRTDIEAFGRRFSEDLANRALATILVAGSFLAMVIVALCILHPELPPFDLAFEAVSALGTVGLTRGITPQLGEPAKLVIIAAMFVGRIGVLAFIVSFMPPRVPPAFRYPETTIVMN